MSPILDNYPEFPVWNFLSEKNIPWKESFESLEKRHRVYKNADTFIVEISLGEILKNEKVKLVGHLFKSIEPGDLVTQWKASVFTEDPQVSASNIKKQFISIFGNPSYSIPGIIDQCSWEFGTARIDMVKTVSGQESSGLEIIICPNYKNFVTEDEEDLIKSCNLNRYKHQNINAFSVSNEIKISTPGFCKRLRPELFFYDLHLGFDDKNEFFTWGKGFLVYVLPTNHVKEIQLIKNIGKEEITFIGQITYENLNGINQLRVAQSQSKDDLMDLLMYLSEGFNLPVLKNEINDQY